MGDKRRGSSWWKPAVLAGAPFGIAMGVFDYVQDGNGWRAAIVAAITGAFFGAFMGRWVVTQRREATAETGVPDGKWSRTELRAGMRRPQDATPELRDDLRRLLRHRLAFSERGRRRQLITFTMVGLLTVALAVLSSPWWWFAAVFWASMLAVTLTEVGRIRRKLVLSGEPAADLPG